MSAQVLTQHNNNRRTGVNDAEVILTHASVRARFRKLFDRRVDPPDEGGPSGWASQIVAQPLLASALPWGDGTRKDVLLIATMHGTVYAFDAGHDCARLWATWLGQPVLDLTDAAGNIRDDKDRFGTNPEWGILSTPVIDPGRRCVYVVMWHNEAGGTYRLHGLDLTTGRETMAPAIIAGAVADAAGWPVRFDPVLHKQRPGLLLIRPADLPPGRGGEVGAAGTLYVAFGASIETSTYHGWVFAYDVESGANKFARRAVWCATPNGTQAGVWQAGAGLASDDEGAIYLMTGNGDVDGARQNLGQSFVKLACDDLRILSWFTPWNWADLNTADRDLGSAGPVCIPGTGYLVGAGKVGILYCLDRRNLGGAGDATARTNPSVDEVQATGDPPHPNIDHDHHVHGSPVYFEPLNRLYLWGENDVLKGFTIDRTSGRFSRTPVATGQVIAPEGMPGGMLSLSTNGGADGIVWATLPLNGDANNARLVEGVLRAFDATSLQEIWNSGQAADRLGHFAKFAPPTIANGRVYVPTYDGTFVVYGVA